MAISTSINNSSIENFLKTNLSLSELSDVGDSVLPSIGNTLIGNGSEWISSPSATGSSVRLDNVVVASTSILNFKNVTPGTVSAIANNANNSVELSFSSLIPSNNLNDVTDRQTAINNLFNGTNNISTTGNATFGQIQFSKSFFYSVLEKEISETHLIGGTGQPDNEYLQVLDADASLTSTNEAILPFVSPLSQGLTYFVVNSGVSKNITLKDSNSVIVTSLSPGQQASVVYLLNADRWLVL